MRRPTIVSKLPLIRSEHSGRPVILVNAFCCIRLTCSGPLQ